MKIKTTLHNLEHYQKYLAVENAVIDFFKEKGYLKIDLPLLSPALIPEAYLEIFTTDFIYQNQKEKLFLTPSPELFLKRLLVAGLGNCYYLGKAFRNSDPATSRHSFEFTILEFYKMGVDYLQLADEVLAMVQKIAEKIFGKKEIRYQGKIYSLTSWEKITIQEAFAKFAGITKEELFSKQLLAKKAQVKGYQIKKFSYEDLFSQIYTQEIEPHLGKNGKMTLIYDYPKEFAALAKLNPDGKTAQRFEFYLDGIELGDCYGELLDGRELERRFLIEDKKREKGGKIKHPIDTGFIEALNKGLKPCSGIAIGLERLAMIFADAKSIQDLKLITIE